MSYIYGGLTLPSSGDLITANSVAENFELTVKNSASGTAPASPAQGQVWYDTTNNVVKVYNGGAWAIISATPIPSQTGNNGKFLTTNGSTLSWNSISGGNGGIVIFYAASGNFVVPAGVTQLMVYAFGGGGGGQEGGVGSTGAVGPVAGFGSILLSVTPGQTIAYTVGEGGRGGDYSIPSPGFLNIGGSGGDTTFGTYCTATGGKWVPTVVPGPKGSYTVYTPTAGSFSYGNGAIKWQTGIRTLLGGDIGGYAAQPRGGPGGYGIGGGGGGSCHIGGGGGAFGAGGQSYGPAIDGFPSGTPYQGYGSTGGGGPTGVIRPAGAFLTLKAYRIVTVGTTDFTAIGASSNTVGVIFQATGTGSGTGSAEEYNGGRGGNGGGHGGGGGGGGGGLIIVY